MKPLIGEVPKPGVEVLAGVAQGVVLFDLGIARLRFSAWTSFGAFADSSKCFDTLDHGTPVVGLEAAGVNQGGGAAQAGGVGIEVVVDAFAVVAAFCIGILLAETWWC